MAELVHDRVIALVDDEKRTYDRVFVYAEPLPGGTWGGWLEFASAKGAHVIRGERETTQSTLEGVAYWATGLQPIYFEGSLDRALRRTASTPSNDEVPASSAGGGAVSLRVITVDPDVPFQVMATRTLVPGVRRHIHNGGTIVYRGRSNPSSEKGPGIYEFVVQFGSENAAAIVANRLWNDLHGLAATLEIDGATVPLQNAAIKEALLAAQAAS